MIGLDFKVLIPMYFEEDYEELCERADYFGEDSLTEDEQYFIDNYHRLDNFISQLSPTDMRKLNTAIFEDNPNKIYDKYAEDEIDFYIENQIEGDDDEFDELCGFPLDRDDY